MSEFERPDRAAREPSVEDVRQLMGASTPHFALHIRNRIRNLVGTLPPDHPARIEGEREIARLERLAYGGEGRGPSVSGERGLPSLRGRPEIDDGGEATGAGAGGGGRAGAGAGKRAGAGERRDTGAGER